MVIHYSFCLQILPFSILSWTQGANKTNHAKNYKLCLAQYLTFSEVIKVHLKTNLPVAVIEHCGDESVIYFSSVCSRIGLGASLNSLSCSFIRYASLFISFVSPVHTQIVSPERGRSCLIHLVALQRVDVPCNQVNGVL